MKRSILYTGLNIAAIILATIFTISCNKKTTPAAEDTGYTTDQAVTEKSFDDVQTIADQASLVSSGSMSFRTTGITNSSCATVTRTANTITINFGNSDCLCKDGIKRRGEIIVTYTLTYNAVGSVHTITFSDFFENDNKVTGTKTVTNMGQNASGQPYYDINVSGAITLSGGGTVSANWSRVRTWTEGYATPQDLTDDVYSVSGTGTMIRQNGTDVDLSISTATPLVMAYGCKWIESGTITYTLPGNLIRTLNYGNTPVCDDQAILILPDGTTYNITLP